METAFKNELELLANRDALFLSFANRVFSLYSGLSGTKWIPEFKKVDDFIEFCCHGANKGKDNTLVALVDKVHNIIYCKGSPVSVVPFLKRMCNKGVKGLANPEGNTFEGYLGKGHYRWNYKAYTLSVHELDAIKMYLGLPILKAFDGEDVETISFKHFGLSAVLVSQGVCNPWGSANDGKSRQMFHNKFKISVISGLNGLKTCFDFYAHHDWQNNVVKLDGKELINAFQCFVSDGVSSAEGFENFCSEFGYDEDSRKAEKIFKECEKSFNKLLALGVSESQAYDLLNELLELENS